MALSVRCSCGRRLSVLRVQTSQRVQCPACGKWWVLRAAPKCVQSQVPSGGVGSGPGRIGTGLRPQPAAAPMVLPLRGQRGFWPWAGSSLATALLLMLGMTLLAMRLGRPRVPSPPPGPQAAVTAGQEVSHPEQAAGKQVTDGKAARKEHGPATEPAPPRPSPPPTPPTNSPSASTPDGRGKNDEMKQPARAQAHGPKPAPGGKDKARAASLPGARGPRVEDVARPGRGIEITGVYVVAGRDQLKDKQSLPRVFPSGTRELRFIVQFAHRPPNGTAVAFEVVTDGGPFKLPGGVVLTLEDRSTGAFEVDMPRGPERGAYPAGPYQALLKINGKLVARLNWTVGGHDRGPE